MTGPTCQASSAVRHATRDTARRAAIAMHRRGEALPWIFRCAACGDWHVAIDPPAEIVAGGRLYPTFARRRRAVAGGAP